MASSGTISSSGIGSGLNVSQIVTALMDAEKGPLNSINKSISTDNAQISAYGSISSQIASFQSSIAGLVTPSTIKVTTASSSGTGVLSVSNDGTALAGEYKITNITLASPQVITSNIDTSSYTSINSSIGSTGSITILGNTITPTTYTVAGIVEAINSANISGVSATMTNLGTSATPDYQIRIVNTSDTSATVGLSDGNNFTGLAFTSAAAVAGSLTMKKVPRMQENTGAPEPPHRPSPNHIH